MVEKDDWGVQTGLRTERFPRAGDRKLRYRSWDRRGTWLAWEQTGQHHRGCDPSPQTALHPGYQAQAW